MSSTARPRRSNVASPQRPSDGQSHADVCPGKAVRKSLKNRYCPCGTTWFQVCPDCGDYQVFFTKIGTYCKHAKALEEYGAWHCTILTSEMWPDTEEAVNQASAAANAAIAAEVRERRAKARAKAQKRAAREASNA